MTFEKFGEIIAKDFDYAVENADWEEFGRNENVYDALVNWEYLSGKYFDFNYEGVDKISGYEQYSIDIQTIPDEVFDDEPFSEWTSYNIYMFSVLADVDLLDDGNAQGIYLDKVLMKAGNKRLVLYEYK